MEQEGRWGQKRYIPLDYESMAVDKDVEHKWVVAEKDRGQKGDGSRRPVRKEA